MRHVKSWTWKTTMAIVAGLCVGAPTPLAVSAAAPVAAATASASLSLSSAACRADKAAGTIKFASVFGYDASPGIIDVYAAGKLGYFTDLCLKVDFVADADSPYDLVSSDSAQITGAGSAADAMSLEANANFEGISTFGDTSDYALLTVPSIKKLTQLEGKVLAYHSTLPVILTEMMVKAGVDVAKVHEVEDPSYNPLLLVQGKFSALQAYQSNEPLTLRADHAKFTMWTPAQFDVAGTFNVQVANRVFLAHHPTAVANFLRAELHAFNYCAQHGSTCVQYLAKAQGPSFNVAHGEAEWAYERALALDHRLPGRGVGVQTTAEWQPEANALLQYKLVPKPVDLNTAENVGLAASLYHGTTLVWP